MERCKLLAWRRRKSGGVETLGGGAVSLDVLTFSVKPPVVPVYKPETREREKKKFRGDGCKD